MVDQLVSGASAPIWPLLSSELHNSPMYMGLVADEVAALSPVMMEQDVMNRTEMVTTFEELRPLLFSIAYRMLGSVSEAEDNVQEALLRWHQAAVEGPETESPKAYLSATRTRLGIDYLFSARVRRRQDVGQWLPEPLLTESVPDAREHAVLADSLSMTLLT